VEDYFTVVEIVSGKGPETYRRLLARYELDPHAFLMVGNSLRSDILPVLEIGGQAVYIPCEQTWVHEVVDAPDVDLDGYHQLAHLGELPSLLEAL
jgi:putative hydrolase of the HAD superfamily